MVHINFESCSASHTHYTYSTTVAHQQANNYLQFIFVVFAILFLAVEGRIFFTLVSLLLSGVSARGAVVL